MVCNAADLPTTTNAAFRSRLIRNILPTEAEAGNTENSNRPFRRAWDELISSSVTSPVRNQQVESPTRRSNWRPGGIGSIVGGDISQIEPSTTQAAPSQDHRQERRRSLVRQLVEQNIVVLRRAHEAQTLPSHSQQGQGAPQAEEPTVLGRRRREEEDVSHRSSDNDIPTFYFSSSPQRETQRPQTQRSSGMISFPLQASPTSRVNIMPENSSPIASQNPSRSSVLHQALLSSWFPFSQRRRLSGNDEELPNIPGSVINSYRTHGIDLNSEPLAPLGNSYEEPDTRLLTLSRRGLSRESSNEIMTSASADRTPFYRLLRESQMRRQTHSGSSSSGGVSDRDNAFGIRSPTQPSMGEVSAEEQRARDQRRDQEAALWSQSSLSPRRDPEVLRRLVRLLSNGTDEGEVIEGSVSSDRPLC